MNIIENIGSTLLARFLSPLDFATATTPRMGNIIAVILKNSIVVTTFVPACFPIIGGKIRFPAPKNTENTINPIINNSFFFIFYLIIQYKICIFLSDIFDIFTIKSRYP